MRSGENEVQVDGEMITEVVKLRDRLQQLTSDIPDQYVIRLWQAIEMASGHDVNLKDRVGRVGALGTIAIYLYNAEEMARLRCEMRKHM